MKTITGRYIISAVNTKDKSLVEKHNLIKAQLHVTNEDIVRAGVRFYEENIILDENK